MNESFAQKLTVKLTITTLATDGSSLTPYIIVVTYTFNDFTSFLVCYYVKQFEDNDFINENFAQKIKVTNNNNNFTDASDVL